MSKIEKIISGAQTGADRAGLDAAIELEIPYGGWVPRGRRSEDGSIPARYEGLRETVSTGYPPRTRLNVKDADGTVVFTYGKPERGSALTLQIAGWLKKPALHIDLCGPKLRVCADTLASWIDEHCVRTLNVAGNRESVSPGITRSVRWILRAALAKERSGE